MSENPAHLVADIMGIPRDDPVIVAGAAICDEPVGFKDLARRALVWPKTCSPPKSTNPTET